MDFTVNNLCLRAQWLITFVECIYLLIEKDCLGPLLDLLKVCCSLPVLTPQWTHEIGGRAAYLHQVRDRSRNGVQNIDTVSKWLKKNKNQTYFLSSRSKSDKLLWAWCHSIVFTINGEDENENCLIICKAQPNRGSSHPNSFYILEVPRSLQNENRLAEPRDIVGSRCMSLSRWVTDLRWCLRDTFNSEQWHNLDKNSFHSVWNLACQEHKKKCFHSTEQECRQQTQQRRRWLGLWLHSALC